jgi:hypothetical protein
MLHEPMSAAMDFQIDGIGFQIFVSPQMTWQMLHEPTSDLTDFLIDASLQMIWPVRHVPTTRQMF